MRAEHAHMMLTGVTRTKKSAINMEHRNFDTDQEMAELSAIFLNSTASRNNYMWREEACQRMLCR